MNRAAYALAAAIAVAPAAVVLQSRVMAPIALMGLLAAVALALKSGWRPVGLPRLAWPLLALVGWGLVSTAWAPDASRALDLGLRLAGLTILAALAGAAGAAAPMPRLGRWVGFGLVVGLSLAALDQATSNAIRAAVRGLAEAPVQLSFGLKNAVAVLALLAPLAVGHRGLQPWFRLTLAGAVVAVAWYLPGEAARLAVLAGLGATGLALWLPRWVGPGIGFGAAALLLATPWLVPWGLSLGWDVSGQSFSALHRLAIWDFTSTRIAEAPLVGWGLDSARAIPGGILPPDPVRLRLLGIHDISPFAGAQRLPLHPHNAALQIWLELGAVGALLTAWLLVVLGRAARSAPAAGCLAAGLVTGMLSYGVWQYWWVSGLLLVAAFLPVLAPMPRRV